MHNKEYAASLLLERLIRDCYPNKRSSAIQPLQWSIMRYLHSADGEPRDISSIARYLGLSNPPVSRAVTTLNKRSLVDKRPTPGSAAVSVTLSEQGKAMLSEDPMRQFAERIAALPNDFRESFIAAIRDISLADTRHERRVDEKHFDR